MSKWEMVRLRDIGQIVTGNTPKKNDFDNYDSDDIPFFKPGDFSIDKITLLENAESYISFNAKDKARILPENSLLVTCIGIIGKVGITRQMSTCNQQINAIIMDNNKVCERYIAYAVMNNRNQLNHIANAAVVPIVNKTQFSKVEILLPPQQIQQQIADVLDRASTLIEKRRRQIDKLDLLVKSQFIEMFGDPGSNPNDHPIYKIESIVKSIEAGWSANGSVRMKCNGELAVLKVSAVTYGEFAPDQYKVIDNQTEIKKYVYPHKGDLLFSRANTKELVGATCIIWDDYPELLLPDKLWRILFNEDINCIYMKYVLSHTYLRRQMTSEATGTSGSMYNISSAKFLSLSFPLAPISLQTQFANFVQQVESKKQLLQRSLDKLELQYKSLMQKCFRGEIF